MSEPYRVIMESVDGERELEVYDNPGMVSGSHTLDNWDAAIRAAWVRLGPQNGGWGSARIIEPGLYPRMVRVLDSDRVELHTATIERIRLEAEEMEAAPKTLELIPYDGPDDIGEEA